MDSVKNENSSSRLDPDVVKIVVIGEPQVGKTSFIRSFYDRHEPAEIYGHNGVKVYPCKFQLRNILGKAAIFEITGDVDFKDEQRIRHSADANGIIFMYASDSPSSLKLINEKWLPEAIDTINSNRTSVVVVGSKNDLLQDHQVYERLALTGEFPVTCEEGIRLFEHHKIRSSRLFLEHSTNDLGIVNQAFNFIFDFELFNRRVLKKVQ